MKEFSVSDARQDLPSLIDKSKKEPIVINRHGKPESVLISVEQYPNIPWEKVKKDLGLK
jgi:prevent-host-death family protein